ncbi:MAG TPA: YkgJ family cysteine cluster protein [Candidatus Nitrosotalea sp.]|nr:YkgJ family cysteine cluster protein [Candidatus Nitrosotalea sp.]
MDFSCVEGCSQCCIEREYYPTKKFGKIGVLVMPDEKKQLESLAETHGIAITILPRIGISETKSDEPHSILAYQMMGKDLDGNTCPFLDVESDKRSPHGGYVCKIYENRPLACRAYPVIQSMPLSIDSKCKFCENCGTPSGNVDSELESLIQIQKKMETKAQYIWRFATGVGEFEDKDMIETGWFLV